MIWTDKRQYWKNIRKILTNDQFLSEFLKERHISKRSNQSLQYTKHTPQTQSDQHKEKHEWEENGTGKKVDGFGEGDKSKTRPSGSLKKKIYVLSWLG